MTPRSSLACSTNPRLPRGCMHACTDTYSQSAIFPRTQYCVGSDKPKGAAPPECSDGPLNGVFPVCDERPRGGAEWRPSSQIAIYTTLPGSIMVATGGHDPGEPLTPTRAFTTRPKINYPTRYNPKRPERCPGLTLGGKYNSTRTSTTTSCSKSRDMVHLPATPSSSKWSGAQSSTYSDV